MTTAAVTGIRKNGADLNTIFEGITGGGAAATGIRKNGTDLNLIFEPLASGSAAAATGIRKNGADLNTIFAALGTVSSGPTINTAVILSNNTANTGICYSRVKLDSNGSYYRSYFNNTYNPTPTGAWLSSGLNTQVWVSRTIQSGSLSVDDIGTGRVALTTIRDMGLVKPNLGTNSCTFTFHFWDAATGGTNIASKQITVSATYNASIGGIGGIGCPLCCFTPDTLITMAEEE